METQDNAGQNKATVRKLYEEILNTGKLELLNQFISPDYSGPRGIKGPAGFAEPVSTVRAAFPDVKWTVEDLVAEGDKVLIRWSWKGTNTNSFEGFPATNKEVNHHAMNVFEFRAGKIVRSWMESDRLGFYQQIGVLSPEATISGNR